MGTSPKKCDASALLSPFAMSVKKVVLTGGPCGDKSSAQESMKKALTDIGWDCYFVPEVPTILIVGGCLPQLITSVEASFAGDNSKLVHFESNLIKLQFQIENSFNEIAAATGRNSVVFYDRGMLDIPAYLPGGKAGDNWKAILDANGWTEQQLLDRYDQVIHMVTAADGAAEFYTTENNAARTETAEQARELDTKMIDCWGGHANLKVVKNTGDFAEKLAATSAHVLGLTNSSKL